VLRNLVISASSFVFITPAHLTNFILSRKFSGITLLVGLRSFTRIKVDNIYPPIEGYIGHYILLATEGATSLMEHLKSYWEFY
jgi:hypothetical protein